MRNNLVTHFELKSLNSVSTFSLFLQLKKPVKRLLGEERASERVSLARAEG